MNYPTLDQVNAADHYAICRWYRFLPSPGIASINRPGKHTAKRAADDEAALQRELPVMNRIAERLKEFGGFTPEISKSLGWESDDAYKGL